ncbi:MAG: ribonuclease D [Spirochaetales bacterium]|nr:ribonuclease D [Spirochaetales bacterium]
MPRPIVLKGDLSAEALEELSRASEVSVDCEMMGLNPVRDRLCLVQISAEKGGCYLVQVEESKGAPNMRALMENPAVVKIFHFARMDMQFLQTRLNIHVKNIYCTKIASRFARTYTDKHGLKELVREIAGENMDKTSQSSDWGRDTLTAEQLRYAAQDVKFLFRIKRTLESMLEREDRLELAHAFMAFLPTLIQADVLGYQDVFAH